MYCNAPINQWRRQLDNWGRIFISSCSALLTSFEIDCFYGLWTQVYEYLPPPPNYWAGSSTAISVLKVWWRRVLARGRMALYIQYATLSLNSRHTQLIPKRSHSATLPRITGKIVSSVLLNSTFYQSGMHQPRNCLFVKIPSSPSLAQLPTWGLAIGTRL